MDGRGGCFLPSFLFEGWKVKVDESQKGWRRKWWQDFGGGIEVLWIKTGEEVFFFLGGVVTWLGLLTGHVLDTHFYSFMYSMIELHKARIHRSPQRVSNFCVVVYTLRGLYWAKSDCFCPFSSCGFKKLTCTALCGITESILIPYDTFFRSIWGVSFDSWRFKGIRTKIGHCSLWCWVTHATMFQIRVTLTSLQLPHSQVQTVQDLADLIWRTPRGLKLRTVDDETYIASLATKVGIKHMDFN